MIFQKELIKSLEKYGPNVAIEYDTQVISYSKLLRVANNITGFLLKEGLKKETVVGIMTDERMDIIYSLIGAINARCVFVLLDPSLPEQRLFSMIEDLNLEHCIVSKRALQRIHIDKVTGIQKIYFLEDILAGSEAAYNSELNYPDFDSNDSLYIYFTSGSTGLPKGIVGKNCSLLQFIQWEIAEFGVDSNTRFSQFISPYFDAFLRDIFAPLLAGGTIHIPPVDEDFFTFEKMVPWLERNGINIIHCVPTLFRLINTDVLTATYFKALRYILLSGEKIIPGELLPWYKLFGSRIQLVNLYGTTETTMIRSFYRIHPEDANLPRIPIGFPISGTELLVAGKDMQPCEVFIPGGLYIISEFTSRGYLNAPELTAGKFLPLPSADGVTRMAFKTGDIARVLNDGKIELIGREDKQIKLNGIRIEPDEIENVLIQSPLIKNALVTAHTNEEGNECLLAFVVRQPALTGRLEWQKELMQYLNDRLPGYMIPADVIDVSEFPLLSNGKVNFKELLKMVGGHTVTAPADAIETGVLMIWKEILGNKTISVEEGFYKAGGNSLGMMKLISKIYRNYHVRVSLSDLVSNISIRKQADFIKRAKASDQFMIPAITGKSLYHASSAQERVFYKYAINKNGLAYNLPMAWEIKGIPDVDKIEHALNQLIERHESLRTSFLLQDGKVLQRIHDWSDFTVEKIVTDEEDQQTILYNFVRPFDLGSAPLIRCAIATSGSNKHALLVDIHHIVCDGLSQMQLMADFLSFYNGNQLPPLSIQYKEYAEWEYQFRESHEYRLQMDFWLQQFADKIPGLQLPVIRTDDQISEEGSYETFRIDQDSIYPLLKTAKQNGITSSTLLFSLFMMYLSQLCGQEDIVAGLTTAGRLQHELDGVVGMFAKTLPVRYAVSMELPFREWLKGLNGHLVNAQSNQQCDLIDIVAWLNTRRQNPLENLVEAVFVFLNFDQHKGYAGDNDFRAIRFYQTSTKYPLLLFVSESENEFNFRLEYLNSYFSATDISLLIQQFITLIKKCAANPDALLTDIMNEHRPMDPAAETNIHFNL